MEIIKTLLKVLMIAMVYLGIGPWLGFYLKGKERGRRVALGFMAWCLVRPRSDFTLMLDSIEKYRGHCRGFEFNFLEALAVGLALAALLERRRDFRWLPPGLWAWFLWVGVGLLSIQNALEPVYVLMPAFKFVKMGFIFVGVFAALHDERDIKAIMRGFAIALIVQLWVCLWARYANGRFQVMGWFEHQNPMAMWSYTLALPILGLALSKDTTPRDVMLFFCAYGAAGLSVVMSVSRACLAAFVVGSVVVMIASYIQGVTFRRVALGALGAICGVLVLAKVTNTYMTRIGCDASPKNDLRVILNEQSAAMLRDNPWVGIGWNNFGLANSRPRGVKYSKMLERWAENQGQRVYEDNFKANPLTESFYWLALAETGSLGFVTFLLFAAITLWYGMRTTLSMWKSPIGLLLFGMTVALSISYFHLRVERILVQTKNLTTWIMYCAILSRAEWWRREAKARRRLP